MGKKSVKQRVKEYRERRKNDTEYKESVKASARKWQRANPEAYKQSCAKRMREYRARKKQAAAIIETVMPSPSNSTCTQNVYTTKQAEGKALSRAERALPRYNKEQKMHVIMKLAEKEGLVVQRQEDEDEVSGGIQKSTLATEVENFYHRDDISRQCPGKNDIRTVRDEEGNKMKVSRRVMCYTVGEAHKIFLQENPGISIGRTLFHEMRPKDVFLLSTKDQTMCACPIHENVQFMCDAAHLGNAEGLVKDKLLCEDPTENCWQSRCNACPFKTGFVSLLPTKENYNVKKWVKGELEITNMSQNKFCEEFKKALTSFIEHLFLKKQQSLALIRDKANLQSGMLLIHCDFAENYAIKYNVEPMECHWTHSPSVVIFTALTYHRGEDGDLISNCFGVVSDCEQNTTLEMANCIDTILIEVNNLGINFGKKVIIWSDGATKHFKNRFAMSYMSMFESMYGSTAEWNFCESYHGKGPMDGVGGTMKNGVFKEVLKGHALVQNAFEFFLTAKQIHQSIHVLYRSKEDMEERRKQFDRVWSGVKSANGILSARRITASAPYKINLMRTSFDTVPMFTRDITPDEFEENFEEQYEVTVNSHSSSSSENESPDEDENESPDQDENESPDEDEKPGRESYVLVRYLTKSSIKYYVGIVADINNNKYDVKFMRRTHDGSFTYPKNNDIDVDLSISNIARVLPEPIMTRRETYFFEGVTFPDNTL